MSDTRAQGGERAAHWTGEGTGGFRTRWMLTGIFFKSLQSNWSLEGSAFMTLLWICLPYLKHHTPGSTSPRTTYASTSSFSFKSAHLRFILSNIITYGLKLLISNTHWNINNWPTTQVTPLVGSTPSHQATFCSTTEQLGKQPWIQPLHSLSCLSKVQILNQISQKTFQVSHLVSFDFISFLLILSFLVYLACYCSW